MKAPGLVRLATILMSVLTGATGSMAGLPEKLNCTAFIYNDFPFLTAFLEFHPDGSIESPTQIEQFGQRQFLPVAPLQTGDDEMLHLLIGNEGDQLRLIVYQASATDPTGDESWRGVLINDQSPTMKEMPAKCVDPVSGL